MLGEVGNLCLLIPSGQNPQCPLHSTADTAQVGDQGLEKDSDLSHAQEGGAQAKPGRCWSKGTRLGGVSQAGWRGARLPLTPAWKTEEATPLCPVKTAGHIPADLHLPPDFHLHPKPLPAPPDLHLPPRPPSAPEVRGSGRTLPVLSYRCTVHLLPLLRPTVLGALVPS